MTKKTTKSDDEFETLNEIKLLLETAKESYWKAAEILYWVRERQGYKDLGYETLDIYCEDGLGKSRQTITQLLKAYEIAVIQLKIRPEDLPDYTKVYLVSEMIEADPKHAQDWIDKAETMSTRDLRTEKKEAKSGVSQTVCKHPNYKFLIFRTCPDCGLQQRDYEAEEKLQKLYDKEREE